MTLERGTLLHKRYRIVEILGQGGMGSVYRAVDENLGVEVAVKENLFTTDEYARQFRLEAVILANLRHPNLPRVTDHFVIGEQGQYLVMDYIEGEDLRQRMERMNTLPDQDVILIGAAMCDALEYLHTRRPPIVHRDVKPGNVKITPDGYIFLVDFGLAKVVQGGQVTTTGARAMTPGYSPPEQYGTARTDARTDIYSLGATLYAALTGVIPEDGLARAMDNAQLTPIRKRNSKASRKLAAVIEKAMAVVPDDRFQTPAEFKKALLASGSQPTRANGEFVVAPPPTAESKPRKEARIEKEAESTDAQLPLAGSIEEKAPPARNRPRRKRSGTGCWPVGLLIVLALILAGLLVSYFIPAVPAAVAGLFNTATPQATPTETLPPIPPTETPTPTSTPEPTATSTPIPTETPTPLPTPLAGGHGQLAFVSDRSGIPQVYLINFDGTGTRPITNMPQGACQPDWSPDGQRVVFVSPCLKDADTFRDTGLYIINLSDGIVTSLPTVAGGDFDPAWSPDGRRIAFTSLRDGHPEIYAITLADLTVVRLTDVGRYGSASQPAWSPLGNQISFTSRPGQAYQIWYMTDNGLTPQQLIKSTDEYWDTLSTWSSDGQTVYFVQRQVGPSASWVMLLRYVDRVDGDADRIRSFPVSTFNPDISPDGLWMAFDGWKENTPPEIYIMSIDGTLLRLLTEDPGSDYDPVWRPGTP